MIIRFRFTETHRKRNWCPDMCRDGGVVDTMSSLTLQNTERTHKHSLYTFWLSEWLEFVLLEEISLCTVENWHIFHTQYENHTSLSAADRIKTGDDGNMARACLVETIIFFFVELVLAVALFDDDIQQVAHIQIITAIRRRKMLIRTRLIHKQLTHIYTKLLYIMMRVLLAHDWWSRPTFLCIVRLLWCKLSLFLAAQLLNKFYVAMQCQFCCNLVEKRWKFVENLSS